MSGSAINAPGLSRSLLLPVDADRACFHSALFAYFLENTLGLIYILKSYIFISFLSCHFGYREINEKVFKCWLLRLYYYRQLHYVSGNLVCFEGINLALLAICICLHRMNKHCITFHENPIIPVSRKHVLLSIYFSSKSVLWLLKYHKNLGFCANCSLW